MKVKGSLKNQGIYIAYIQICIIASFNKLYIIKKLNGNFFHIYQLGYSILPLSFQNKNVSKKNNFKCLNVTLVPKIIIEIINQFKLSFQIYHHLLDLGRLHMKEKGDWTCRSFWHRNIPFFRDQWHQCKGLQCLSYSSRQIIHLWSTMLCC